MFRSSLPRSIRVPFVARRKEHFATIDPAICRNGSAQIRVPVLSASGRVSRIENLIAHPVIDGDVIIGIRLETIAS